jgi:lipopolysaccharide export system permease protein
MPRILNRYILKEVSIPFVLTLMILTVTAFLSKIIKLVDLLVTHGVSPSFSFWFIVSVMPSFLRYTLPLSLLVAILITFTRLSSDSEITAMKASGLSLFSVMKPIMALAFVVFVLNLLVTLYAFPWGNMKLKSIIYDTARSNMAAGIEEQTFYDRFKGMVFYVDRLKSGENEMEGIFISEKTEGEESNIFFAKRGVFISGTGDTPLYLKLYDGTIHRRSADEDAYHIADFSTYLLGIEPPQMGGTAISDRTHRELYPKELLEWARKSKSMGHKTGALLVNIHKRFSLPAAVFIFALLGVPLGMQKIRSARFAGFSIAIGVVLVYYMLSTVLETLGDAEAINPILSAWGSDIIMGGAGLYIFYMTARDRPIAALRIVSRISAGVRSRFKRH